MGKKVIDLTGERFGRLTVIERVGTKNRKSVWECKCECGNIKEVVSNNLISGNTKSCGCLKYSKKGLTQKDEKHLKLWHVHRDIIRRCTDKNSSRYKYYGGRGITVCDRWLEDYLNFYDDIVSTIGLPNKGDTIDRIDNDKGYFIGNVKWSNMTEQAINKRSKKEDRSLRNITKICDKYRVKISRYGLCISSYMIEDLDRAKDLRDFYEYLFSGSKKECQQLYKEQCYLKK